jgi:hypothetical protein
MEATTGFRNKAFRDFISGGGLWVTLFTFAVFFVYAAEIVPAVNESHYMLKAFVAYHPGSLSQDIFLGSADTHWLFFQVSGALTTFLSLELAVWTTRLLGWISLAIGWCLLHRATGLPQVLAPFLAACWLALLNFGQLSGEWVVGGVEAKVFAYALTFIGWSFLFTAKPWRAWPWLGAASALHVLVGGWSVIVAAIAIGLHRYRSTFENWKRHLVALIVGGLLSLPGLLPALKTTDGVTPEENAKAAEIYVYQRIPHHLCFSKFSWQRRTQFLVPLGGLAIVSLLYFHQRKIEQRRTSQAISDQNSISTTREEFRRETDSTKQDPCADQGRLWIYLAGGTLVLAGIGIVIEQVGMRTDPIVAAKLLKYYWFRLVDPVVPMALVFVAALVADRYGIVQPVGNQFPQKQWWGVTFWLLTIAVGGQLIASRFNQLTNAKLPEADFRTLAIKDKTVEEQESVYRDWRNACRWIRTQTPDDSLWLTPRHQQTFKWYAGRQELACWKDIPQDSRSMLQWWERFKDCYRTDNEGDLLPWTTERLLELRDKYRIRFVLVDRRIQEEPPLLPMVYPLGGEWNDHYAIFEIRP